MTDLTALAEALSTALQDGIGVGTADPAAAGTVVLPAEQAATLRMRPTRYREFAAGRTAARLAMAELGLPQAAVPMGPDRAPVWPVELCGSIAHCGHAAVAIVARRARVSGLGIDIEEDTDLPTDLWPEVLTHDEQSWLRIQPTSERGRRAKEIFCAKEAIHKLHHPLTGQMLGFDEVSVTVTPRGFLARLPVTAPDLPRERTGQILRIDNLVVTLLVGVEAIPGGLSRP